MKGRVFSFLPQHFLPPFLSFLFANKGRPREMNLARPLSSNGFARALPLAQSGPMSMGKTEGRQGK